MTRKEAIDVLSMIVAKLSYGYHPESELSDYVDSNDNSSYTDSEIEEYEPLHIQMKNVLGDDIWLLLSMYGEDESITPHVREMYVKFARQEQDNSNPTCEDIRESIRESISVFGSLNLAINIMATWCQDNEYFEKV